MPAFQPQQQQPEEQQQQQHAEMRGEGQGKPLYHHHRYNLRHRFELGRTLGTGTYGKVKHAVEKSTSEEVAIKYIKKTKIQDEADLNRIRREIRILSRLNHPHIVNVREVFEKKDRIILVMDCALGGELYEYVASRQQVDLEEARRIFQQIAQALHYAHQQGIVHRDLKLENIILDQEHNVKVADFGLANFYQKGELLHTFCGSPLYASPEIVNGTPYLGPEVDIWSMGVVLYTLVHGSMPFESSNLKALRNQISSGLFFEPPSLTEADPLIRHMLRVDPEERASMEEVLSHPWLTAQTPPRPLAPAPLEDPHTPLPDPSCPETSFDEDEALFDIGRCKSPLELEGEEEVGEEGREGEEELLPDPGEEDVFPSYPNDLSPSYPDLQKQQQEEEMTTAFCREDVGVYGEEEEEEEYEDEEVNAIFPEESLPPGDVVLHNDVSPSSPESGTESGETQAGSDVSNSGDETTTTRKVFDSERKPRRGILKRRGKFSGGDSGCILQDADPYFCRAEDLDPTPTLQPQLAPLPPAPHLPPDLSHPLPAHTSTLGATTPSSVLPSLHQPNPDFISADDFSQLLLPATAAAGEADAEPEPGCPSNSAPSVCTCTNSRQQSSSNSAVVMRRRGILKRSGQQAADPKKRLSVGSTSSNSSADLLDLSYDSGEGEQFLAVLAAQGGNFDAPGSTEGSSPDTPRDVEGVPPPCLPPGGYQPRFPLEMYDLEGRPEVPDTYVPRFPPEMYELPPGERERERVMTPREGMLEGEGELEEAGDLETPGHPEMLRREGCGLATTTTSSISSSSSSSISSSSLPYKPRFPPECYSSLGEGEVTGYRPRFPPEMYNLSDSAPASSFPLRYSPGLFSESLLARSGSGQEESGDLAGARRRLRELRLFLSRHPHSSQRAGGDLAALNLAGEGGQWGGEGRLGRRPEGGQQQLEVDNTDVVVKALEICSRVR